MGWGAGDRLRHTSSCPRMISLLGGHVVGSCVLGVTGKCASLRIGLLLLQNPARVPPRRVKGEVGGRTVRIKPLFPAALQPCQRPGQCGIWVPTAPSTHAFLSHYSNVNLFSRPVFLSHQQLWVYSPVSSPTKAPAASHPLKAAMYTNSHAQPSAFSLPFLPHPLTLPFRSLHKYPTAPAPVPPLTAAIYIHDSYGSPAQSCLPPFLTRGSRLRASRSQTRRDG